MNAATTIVRLLAAVLIVFGCSGAARDESDNADKLPEKITRISKEDLISKVPSFYYFDYQADPMPGKRLWLRVNAKKWIERYPDGMQSTFLIVGHAVVDDVGGTIVVKATGDEEKTETPNDGKFQAFISDKGDHRMHHLCRSTAGGNTKWTDLGEMKKVE